MMQCFAMKVFLHLINYKKDYFPQMGLISFAKVAHEKYMEERWPVCVGIDIQVCKYFMYACMYML